MALPQSKVTAEGQISVPAEIRRKLGTGSGSVLEWEEEGDRVIVRRAGRYSSEDIHRAVFSRKPEPKSSEELKRGISEYLRRKNPRR
jgi:antitoxin PrlF